MQTADKLPDSVSPNPFCEDDDVQSKEVRHYYRQCQKCWKRRAPDVKLFVCSSCKITSYCSVQCQKADWKFHKPACKSNVACRTLMEAQDLEALAKRLETGKDLDRPLSSTVGSEMGEFLKRFRPIICQAGYRCLGVARDTPEGWKTQAFEIRVARIPNPPLNSRPWARYKVVSAKAVPTFVLLRLHGESMRETLKQGEIYNEENERLGCIGTIMTIVKCDSAGPDMRLVSWGGYGPGAYDDPPPGEDWFTALVEAVERVSGRMK